MSVKSGVTLLQVYTKVEAEYRALLELARAEKWDEFLASPSLSLLRANTLSKMAEKAPPSPAEAPETREITLRLLDLVKELSEAVQIAQDNLESFLSGVATGDSSHYGRKVKSLTYSLNDLKGAVPKNQGAGIS